MAIMKKVSIAIDDWKETQFIKAFKEAGFPDMTITKLPHKCKLIAIHIEPDKVETVRRLCVKLQHTIRRGDN
jgi:hypothetical protein